MSLTNREMARLGELLDEALELTPEQRCVWLDTLSSFDQPLVRTLRDALLVEDTGASGPLDRPPRIESGGGQGEAAARKAGERLGAYELLRPLGSGGMADVWLACRTDGAFERQVALKIPRLHNRPVEMTARFALECNILAALECPGIARLYDAGVDASGVPYIAMEYVQGEPLVAWCDARGLGEAMRIRLFLQVLDVVAHAHERQVIHRDLKPANILVTGQGEVRLLDFGTARLLQRKTGGSSLTRAFGLALTPEYASPELLRGESIDSRSDIYSLGVVLHELLTGARPSQSARPPATGSATRLRGAIRDVVMTALQPDPADRFTDATSFGAALRPFADGKGHAWWGRLKTRHLRAAALATLAVILIGTVGAGRYLFRSEATVEQPQVTTLAVLPLQSLDPNDHALGFGIAEAVIRRMSQTGEVTVRPASSVRQFLAEGTDAITAAKQMSVDSVLEGTVQRAGGRIRIGVNLLRADGTSLWAESFDTPTTGVIAAQDAISQQLASHLRLQLTSAQHARLSKRSTSNPAAYDFYARGIYNYDQRGRGPTERDQNEATIELFKNAVAADPNYALAHAMLAHAYAFHAVFIVPDEQEKWIALANDEMNRADAIDAQIPETHLARALVLFSDASGFRASAAIRAVHAARQFDPNIGHAELAGLYDHVGLEDHAEREFQRAFEIDPSSRILAKDYVSFYRLLHRPDEFIVAHRKYFPEDPVSASYYLMKGDLEGAMRQMGEPPRKNASRLDAFQLPYLLALRGEKKASEELLARKIREFPISTRSTDYHHVTYEIACIHAINGNGPEAIEWLQKTAENGFRSHTVFRRDPYLEKIRRLPQFAVFMTRMKAEYEQLRTEFD